MGLIFEPKTETEIRQQIIWVSKELRSKNMLASADGNISYRISDDKILITPSGMPKSFINEEDIAVIDINNKVLSGKPSSERLMHLEVYKKAPLARSVVHAHPPRSIAWSIAFPDASELPIGAMSELILAVGSVPIVKYARPGTPEMGSNLHPFLPKNRVMILSRHGALSWGETLIESFCGMERLEHSVEILSEAHRLGTISELDSEELEELRKLREQLGDKTL
jgi:L-fuculose-phosphate aldolase